MYCLVKEYNENGLCLACTKRLLRHINAFCYQCKMPRSPDWTTDNKLLDSFIMESWSNVENKYDVYIQWIEYSLLNNVEEMTSLRHGCTHIADWLEPTAYESTRVSVTLKRIDEQNDRSFDFHRVNYFTCKQYAHFNRLML